jgi:predicted nuclease of predicted toxin-antitoxin system
MKIKLDENLPAGLVESLADLGHDVDSVPQEALAGQPDSRVWDAAQEAQRFLVTQDLDFSDVRRFAPGTHQGILLVRLSNPSR